MSDVPQGPGWWQASDGRWYPPATAPGAPGAPTDATASGVPLWSPPPQQQDRQHGVYQQYQPALPGATPSGLPTVQGLAVSSLVLGICGILSCLLCFVGLVLSLVGLPLGITALVRINGRRADPGARGLAIAGVVTNAIALLLAVGFLVLIFASRSVTTTVGS